MEKLFRPLGVDEVAPQGLEGCMVELDALLQSMPPPVVVAGAPYEGVDVGDIMLFIPIAGLFCCCEEPYDGLPIPGLVGAIAGNDELRLPKLVSGVIARLCALGGFSVGWLTGGGDTGGEDQENVAAGELLLEDLPRLFPGRDGSMVDDDAEFDPLAQGSPPPSMSVLLDAPVCPPRTRASKSPSPPPLPASRPFDVLGPPKVMNSFRVVAVALFAPSSCSLRVCSPSTRADMDLIKAM